MRNQVKVPKQSGSGSGGGSPVYGLGFIGAVVWFWNQTNDPKGRALGVLKAMVWPAFLVHDAFRALARRDARPDAGG